MCFGRGSGTKDSTQRLSSTEPWHSTQSYNSWYIKEKKKKKKKKTIEGFPGLLESEYPVEQVPVGAEKPTIRPQRLHFKDNKFGEGEHGGKTRPTLTSGERFRIHRDACACMCACVRA